MNGNVIMYKYVTSQSINKKKFERRMYDMSDILIEHLCKMFASFPVSKSDAEGILLDCNDDLSVVGYDKLPEEYIESVSNAFYRVCSNIVSICLQVLTSKNHIKYMKYFNEVVRKAFSDNGVQS